MEDRGDDTHPMDIDLLEVSTVGIEIDTSTIDLGLGLWTPFQPSEVLNLRSFTYDRKNAKIMKEQLKKVPTIEGIPISVVTRIPIMGDVRENPIATATTGTTFMSANEDNI
jgi:hypothetical protein